MVIDSIVNDNLSRLKELKKDQLTFSVVTNLVGMSHGALYNRVEDGFDYKKKGDIAKLIRENRPVLEEWPDTSDLERLLHVGRHVFRLWYRNVSIRESIGAVKVLRKIRFNPRWFEQIRSYVEKKGDFITSREAFAVLGISSSRLRGSKKLFYIQPAGKGTCNFYPRKDIMELKRVLDEINNTDLLKSNEVSTRLGIRRRHVTEFIPHKLRHPLSGEFLYDPQVIEQYRDEVFVRCTPFAEIIRYCEREILRNSKIKNKIQNLISLGSIPSERIEGRRSLIYLSTESETMVKNIYTHLKRFYDDGISLIALNDAAKQIGLNASQLGILVRTCGEKYLLISDKPVEHRVYIVKENRKVFIRPRIPYVRWTENSNILLTNRVVNDLKKHVNNAREAAIAEGYKPFDGYWYGRLAKSIVSR